MTEGAILILTLFMGILLGTIFYGGLWWTVGRIVTSKKPGVWLVGSFLMRTMITIGGFLFVAQSGWRRILACFIGFLAARIGVTLLTRAPRDMKTRLIQETTP